MNDCRCAACPFGQQRAPKRNARSAVENWRMRLEEVESTRPEARLRRGEMGRDETKRDPRGPSRCEAGRLKQRESILPYQVAALSGWGTSRVPHTISTAYSSTHGAAVTVVVRRFARRAQLQWSLLRRILLRRPSSRPKWDPTVEAAYRREQQARSERHREGRGCAVEAWAADRRCSGSTNVGAGTMNLQSPSCQSSS